MPLVQSLTFVPDPVHQGGTVKFEALSTWMTNMTILFISDPVHSPEFKKEYEVCSRSDLATRVLYVNYLSVVFLQHADGSITSKVLHLLQDRKSVV